VVISPWNLVHMYIMMWNVNCGRIKWLWPIFHGWMNLETWRFASDLPLCCSYCSLKMWSYLQRFTPDWFLRTRSHQSILIENLETRKCVSTTLIEGAFLCSANFVGGQVDFRCVRPFVRPFVRSFVRSSHFRFTLAQENVSLRHLCPARHFSVKTIILPEDLELHIMMYMCTNFHSDMTTSLENNS
jgi:hypothetical protein